MGEGSVFDVVRVRRALSGFLAADEKVHAVAVDDGTRSYWVLTSTDFVVVKDERITFRVKLADLAGTIRTDDEGLTLVVHNRSHGQVVVGTFRRANKVTSRLAEQLSPADQPTDPDA